MRKIFIVFVLLANIFIFAGSKEYLFNYQQINSHDFFAVVPYGTKISEINKPNSISVIINKKKYILPVKWEGKYEPNCAETYILSAVISESDLKKNGIKEKISGIFTIKVLESSENESKIIDNTFRIDIKEGNITYDFYPDKNEVTANAKLYFKMRSGQTKPIFHFKNKEVPGIMSYNIKDICYKIISKSKNDKIDDYKFNRNVLAEIKKIKLNGEIIDINQEITKVRKSHYAETGYEIQKNLSDKDINIMDINYRLKFGTYNPGYFFSDVNDILGVGNEVLFPTINSPEEIFRHKITIKVHSSRKYKMIGSGFVSKVRNEKDYQEFILDTEREVSSYTVLFLLAPEDEVIYKEKKISGIDVRIMAHKSYTEMDEAFKILEKLLPSLQKEIGDFPMKTGLSVYLIVDDYYGGMEFYGATVTDLESLLHEVFHMYFACSTINKTYRDSWLDEAITTWYEEKNSDEPPLESSFHSNYVGEESPVDVGFNDQAYDTGFRAMRYVEKKLGGRDKMMEFLKYLHSKYMFKPYDTFEFLSCLREYSGYDFRNEFLQWFYSF